MCIDTITLTFRTSGDEKFTKYAACKVRISSTKTKSTSTVQMTVQLILNIIHACASFSSMIYFFYVQPHYTSTNIHRRDSICVILYRRKHKHTRHSLQSAQQTTYIEKNVETKMFLEWPHACEREREANKQKTHTQNTGKDRTIVTEKEAASRIRSKKKSFQLQNSKTTEKTKIIFRMYTKTHTHTHTSKLAARIQFNASHSKYAHDFPLY